MFDDLDKELAKICDPGARRRSIEREKRPSEPQLLDTCVIQHLDWVERQLAEGGSVVWDQESVAGLADDRGRSFADELIDLGTLYKELERRDGYPWVVCRQVVDEASACRGAKGERLMEIVRFFARHQEAWASSSYPDVSLGRLLPECPLIAPSLVLRGLGVSHEGQLYSADGPLGFLADRGDRLIAGCALLANVPAILTTDIRTFWREREALAALGLEVYRPSDLLAQYEVYWAALAWGA